MRPSTTRLLTLGIVVCLLGSGMPSVNGQTTSTQARFTYTFPAHSLTILRLRLN